MPFFIARLTGTDSVVLSILAREFGSAAEAEALAQSRYPDGRYLVVEADRPAQAARLANQRVMDEGFQRQRGRGNAATPFRPTE